ncbi:MAG: MOSC domain-containing protein [Spirochaetaceae bacterium]
MSGRIIAINISEKKGVPKQAIESANFIEDFGIEGDAHAGKWHRQVSLLGDESIEKIRKQGVTGLCTGRFAENLTTEGIILYELPVGTHLRIGETVQEITQIGKECHKHCAIYHQVGDCVMPREGIFTKVISGGKVNPGDTIEVIKKL